MKDIIMLLFLGPWIMVAAAFGQKLSEWVDQQGTQIKYLQDQIAELQLFKGVLEKGYDIAREGTGVILSIKQGDFVMHQDHFDSLLVVKPVVSTDDKAEAIRELLAATRTVTAEINKEGFEGKDVSKELYAFTSSFWLNVTSGCGGDTLTLSNLTTSGRLEMNDAERLEKLDRLYDRVLNRYLAAVQLEGSLMSLKQMRR